MSLESNSWINREVHKVSNEHNKQLFDNEGHQQQRGALKIPVKQFVMPAESINRFTQTEQPNQYRTCVDNEKEVMFETTTMQTQQNQQQQQHHVTELYSLQKKDDKVPTTVTEFPFCYNVNMLQKVHQQTTTNATIANTEEKGYRFDVSQPFSYNYALVNQMSLAAAASTATFKCDVCGLMFGHLSLLNHHKRIHTNPPATERTYSCEICGSNFNQASELKNHEQTAHNLAKSKCSTCGVEIDCEHSGKKKLKFPKCENCEDGSERETNFEGTQEVATETEEPVKGAHPVKRRGGIQNPVEKPFHCNICDGSFSRYSSLWSHKRLHSGDKPFKCEFCGLAFARAAYLKNHGRVHSGERPFKCDVCGMQFSQAPHLKNHERIHSGERPYECEICNKTFARHSTLWNHRRIHTGEKPYRCNVCGSAFNQATHLKNHAKVHTGEKPHRCDICEVGFSDRFALKRHRGIHEKYGQTTPANQQQQNQGQQTNINELTNQPRLDELYKCDVTAGIAFPGFVGKEESSSTSDV